MIDASHGTHFPWLQSRRVSHLIVSSLLLLVNFVAHPLDTLAEAVRVGHVQSTRDIFFAPATVKALGTAVPTVVVRRLIAFRAAQERLVLRASAVVVASHRIRKLNLRL